MKSKVLSSNDGFTLVELIVVIAVIIVLISMLIPAVASYITKAEMAVTQNDCNEFFTAANVYVSTQISEGNTFAPNQVLSDPSVLWSGDAPFMQEPKGTYSTIEIKLNADGNAVKYVYYDRGDFDTDVPRGASGKVRTPQ